MTKNILFSIKLEVLYPEISVIRLIFFSDINNNFLLIFIISIYQISGFSCVLIGSRNSEYPWLFTVLRTERNMARRFAKVSEEEIEEAFFYPSDLVNTKTTIPLRVGEERWIYTSTLCVSVYIHHYSPPLRGIVVYY